jgi:hypothetical protein
MAHSGKMGNSKSQIPNTKQAPNPNSQMTKTIPFGILVIGIYLGFGAWNLEFHFTLFPVRY